MKTMRMIAALAIVGLFVSIHLHGDDKCAFCGNSPCAMEMNICGDINPTCPWCGADLPGCDCSEDENERCGNCYWSISNCVCGNDPEWPPEEPDPGTGGGGGGDYPVGDDTTYDDAWLETRVVEEEDGSDQVESKGEPTHEDVWYDIKYQPWTVTKTKESIGKDSEYAWIPAVSTVWEGESFEQTYTGEDVETRAWTQDGTRFWTQEVSIKRTLTGAINTYAIYQREYTRTIYYSSGRTETESWSGGEISVLEDTEPFYRESNDSRTDRWTTPLYREGIEAKPGSLTRMGIGTKPLNWRNEDRLIRDWYTISDWSPSAVNLYKSQSITQTRSIRQDWQTWEINDRNDERWIRDFTKDAVESRVVEGELENPEPPSSDPARVNIRPRKGPVQIQTNEEKNNSLYIIEQ